MRSGYSLSPLPSQAPFHHAGKGRKPSTRPPPPPLVAEELLPAPRTGVELSLGTGPRRRHRPITGRNLELSPLLHKHAGKWSPSFDLSAFKLLQYVKFNDALCLREVHVGMELERRRKRGDEGVEPARPFGFQKC